MFSSNYERFMKYMQMMSESEKRDSNAVRKLVGLTNVELERQQKAFWGK